MDTKAVKALKALYSELYDEMHEIAPWIPRKSEKRNFGKNCKWGTIYQTHRGFYCAGKVDAIARTRGKIYQIIRDLEKEG